MPAYYALIPGILVTASVVPRVLRALATSRWSSTTGRVLMRDIDETAEKYQPVLEYSYEANGSQYRGHRISFDLPMKPAASSTALQVFYKYSPGREVTVFFDPKRPHVSVLERGLTSQLLVPLIGGLLLIMVGLL